MDYKSQIMRVIVNHPGATRAHTLRSIAEENIQAPQRIACMRCLLLVLFAARSR